MKRRTIAMVVVVDFLSALLLMQAAIIARSTIEQRKPHPPTYDTYAVILTWPATSADDLDLYVEDPAGRIVYFAAKDAGVMHLEHDDLGSGASAYGKGQPHFERVVIRGLETGEFVANVHVYTKRVVGRTPATVELWRLEGRDARLVSRRLLMGAKGDEQTAFRFTLTADGGTTGLNRLPKSLVGSLANPAGGGA